MPPNAAAAKRERDRGDMIHRAKLNNMKASVDNSAPQRFIHLEQNLKKAQKEEERYLEIEKHNGLLLSRLSKIAERKGVEGSGADKEGKALLPGEAHPITSKTFLNRKQQLVTIQSENQAILKRIQEQSLRPSCYDLETIERDWERTRGYARRIAKPPIL